MRDDVLLRRLDGEMVECAQRALASPQQRDAFEYGRMAGMYAGLHRAKELVVEMHDEEAAKEF